MSRDVYRSAERQTRYAESFAACAEEIDLQEFYLDGKKIDADIAAAVTGGNIEATIEAAATLTLDVVDPERQLLRSGIFNSQPRLSGPGGLHWILVAVGKSDDNLTLTFEDYRVRVLRRLDKPRRVAAGTVIREQFARQLVAVVRHPEIKFSSPNLRSSRTINRTADAERETSRQASRQPGLKGRGITVKGAAAQPDQIRILELALDVARSESAGTLATLALIVALIQESGCRNLPGGDRDSRGPLQVRDSTASSLRIDNRDVGEVTTTFLTRGYWGRGGAIKIAKENPRWSAGKVAQQVQGSAYPAAYDPHLKEARKILKAYGGGGGSTTEGETERQAYSVGPPGGPRGESVWAATGRIAEEIGWRRFIVGDTFFFASEKNLLASKPRLVIQEGVKGVDRINYDIDIGRPVDQATVTCRAAYWVAPPGSVVEVIESGPADGRWLVSSCQRGLYDPLTTIELRRGSALQKEKAPESEEDAVTSSSSSRSSSSTRRGKMQRPVSGGRITSGFGRRQSPTKGASSQHDGIDYGVPIGTTCKAVWDGTVSRSLAANGGYGQYIEIRHADGLTTFYAHLSSRSVAAGDKVQQGDTIGKTGNTGTSTGPHLHFGCHKNGKPVDPEVYL